MVDVAVCAGGKPGTLHAVRWCWPPGQTRAAQPRYPAVSATGGQPWHRSRSAEAGATRPHEPTREFEDIYDRMGQLMNFAFGGGVRAIPTLLVLRQGEAVARQAGAAPAARLRAWIEEAIR